MNNLTIGVLGGSLFLWIALAGCTESNTGPDMGVRDGGRPARDGGHPVDARTEACIVWRGDGVCLSDPPPANDHDRDGFTSDVDCDDEDEASFPGASETLCNGVDENCDGSDFCPPDEDGDGSMANVDCNDHDPLIYPYSPNDTTCDGVDQDCNGFDACDLDGDGVFAGSDCDDNDARAYPGNTEIMCNGVDDDCYDGECCDQDADLDGYPCRLDCNDHNQLINPGVIPPTRGCPVDWNCGGVPDGNSSDCL